MAEEDGAMEELGEADAAAEEPGEEFGGEEFGGEDGEGPPADDGEDAGADDGPAENGEAGAGEDGGEDGAAPEEEGRWEMITEAYGGKYEVHLRQQLKTEEDATNFITQLQEAIDRERASDKALVFEDFDISQNLIAVEQLEMIFSALADGGVHVERFRGFGIPTMNDEAATLLAGWLAGVTAETAPFEMHLSDCAITDEGFQNLIKALEENEAFPGPDPRNPTRGKVPLYIRLENNYISDPAIKASIDEGACIAMKKAEGVRHSSSVKCRLLVREDGSFQQKRGDPPAPEDFPPPKPVKGKGKGNSYSNKSKGRLPPRRDEGRRDDGYNRRAISGKGSGGKGRYESRYESRDGGRYGAPPWQALPSSRPQYPSERYSDRRGASDAYRRPPREVERPRDREREREVERPQRWAPVGGGGGGGGGGGYRRADPRDARDYRDGGRDYREARDYRDAPRGGGYGDARGGGYGGGGGGGYGGGCKPSSRRPPEGGGGGGYAPERASKRPRTDFQQGARQRNKDPPHPWEKHYSEEYDLHYYWNSKTGESTWEFPAR